MDNKLKHFNKVMNWIYNNTIDSCGIAVSSNIKEIYPEVTGYYIPTLLQWGEKDLAISFAKYLCSIQKQDGSWYDSNNSQPYVFDSAQILKGLLSIRNILPEVDNNIVKGCDWILSNMQPDGRLTTPSKDAWGADESFCSELIHIYCLSPIKEAGHIFNRKDYNDSIDRILHYYKKEKMDKIMNFSLLSHFYAYVMEGLYDLGEIGLCREAMNNLEKYRNKNGAIPGLNNVKWICSTGLFQLALVWYKLGDLEKGNSLFYYALDLQNKSGGWFGSYPAKSLFGTILKNNKPYYFENDEISWVVKYFLDALSLKEKLEFEKQANDFLDNINENDGRYLLIKNEIASISNNRNKICDIGCGKGRYLKRLVKDIPNNEYYACDISNKVMKNIDYVKEKRVGSMTNIPYNEDTFDMVYACESFEHAIHLKSAFKEMYRITKKGGKIIIIDKPIEELGSLQIYEWEQWISDEDMKNFAEECNAKIDIINSIPYEGKDDGLFRGWVVTKK